VDGSCRFFDFNGDFRLHDDEPGQEDVLLIGIET
jgi:hypothetical protein